MNDNMETTPGATAAWEDITVFGVGGWLFFSPLTLTLHSSAVDMFVTVGAGVVMASLAAIAMRKDRPSVEWAIMAWGATLVALPWALGFAMKEAITNAIACGVMAIALAAWRVYDLRTRRRTAVPVVPLAGMPAVAIRDDKRRAA